MKRSRSATATSRAGAARASARRSQAVNGAIADAIVGFEAEDQAEIDARDDRPRRHRQQERGSAPTPSSASAWRSAKAAAEARGLPLYRYVGGVGATLLPVPMMNILNGGAHADNPIDFQEFMVMPVGAPKLFRSAALRGRDFPRAEERRCTPRACRPRSATRAASRPTSPRPARRSTSSARRSQAAGYKLGSDVLIALDCASTEFFKDGAYAHGQARGATSSPDEMADYLAELADDYPIASIEDGMAEDDMAGWKALTDALGDRVQLVGDDLFVTNEARLADGIRDGIANSILVKVNQIGTLTETVDAVRLAQSSGYTAVMSHRSGETEDSTIADLAVALGCGQIKTGSLARSDRTAKYNQLLRIEEELGDAARYPGVGGAARLQRPR